MPIYTIQDPTGRRLQVRGSAPPNPAQIKAIFDANPVTSPTTPPESLETPTTLERVTGVLNAPLNLLTGTLASGLRTAKGTTAPTEQGLEGWEQVLSEAGLPKGRVRSGLALAGDIVLDPLNVMPSSVVTKPLGLAGDALKAFGRTGTGQDIAKLGELAKPVRALFQQYPGTSTIIGKQGLSAEDALRLEAAKQAALPQAIREQLGPIAEQLPTEETRKAVARLLDQPIADTLDSRLPSVYRTATAQRFAGAPSELATAARKLDELLKTQGLTEQQKGILETMRENYFPYVFKSEQGPWKRQVFETSALKGTTPFSEVRQSKSLDAAIQAAAKNVDPATGKPKFSVVDDAIEAVEKRLLAGQRAVSNVDFVRTMVDDFGNAVQQPGFRRLNTEQMRLPEPLKKELASTYFPEALADQLDKTAVIWGNPQGLLGAMQKANSLFKAVVTATPSFHATNLQGNVGMMYAGGMDAADVLKAYDPRTAVPELHALMDQGRIPAASVTKVLGMKNPIRQRAEAIAANLDALRARPIPGSNLTVGQAFDAAKQYNLFGSSESQVLYEMINAKPGALRKAADVVRFVGSRYVEDPGRWGMLVDQLKKGVPLEKAILHTKNYLLDYNELTDAEKALRDYGVMPFYSWFRKVVPTLVKTTVTSPKRINILQDVYGAPEQFTGNVEMPEWMREEGYVPRVGLNPLKDTFLRRVEGETPGSVGVMRAANPMLELNRATNPSAAVAGLLGPIPRALIEGMTKRDLRTGQSLLDTRTGYVKAAPVAALAESMGLTGIPGGAIPTPTGMMQAELPAFVLRQVPLPLVPYAQQFLGSVPEQLGQTRALDLADRVQLLSLRIFGLTPRDLTPDQQLQVYRDALDALAREANAQEMQNVADVLRKRRP
jgi:hypothetical protein